MHAVFHFSYARIQPMALAYQMVKRQPLTVQFVVIRQPTLLLLLLLFRET